MGCQPVWFVILHAVKYCIGVKPYHNRYILTCDSICSAVEQVHKLFAVQCSMRMEFSGAVQFADKNFVDGTISRAVDQ